MFDVRICTEDGVALITTEEWQQTIQNSNNWKASGLDSIPADVIRQADLF
jgi:hypothetical protein